MDRSYQTAIENPKSTLAHQRFESIYIALRDRICLLHYPPGTKLSETRLAEEFRVSRTPIRRVLQRLEFEQLAQRRQGTHTVVTDFDLSSFIDIYEVRMILFENIDRLSPCDGWWKCVSDLENLTARLYAIREKVSLEEFGRLHMSLQETFSGIIQNDRARDILMQLYFQIARIWLSLIQNMNWEYEVDSVLSEIESLLAAAKHRDIRAMGLIRRNYISMNIMRMKVTSLAD